MPKHARQCNAVAWNSVENNLLVSGLEKYRMDHSLLLWDISKSPLNPERMYHHNSTPIESIRPISEAGVSETVHSLSWFNKYPKCLVAGLNNKHLKIIDFRGMIEI